MKKLPPKWKGYYKVIEESGELGQVLGKLVYQQDAQTIQNLHDEIGDTLATLEYFIKHNGLDRDMIVKRFEKKMKRFESIKLPAMIPVK